jgi:hypothetical protein
MNRFRERGPAGTKLTLLLVGSQHGTESSGAEALLLVARDILEGKLAPYLEDMNLVFIPNSNPDGRDLKRRVNGNGVNLSTNFVDLTEPESKGIINALHRWNPQVLLDVHESAVLKKKSLAKQGYLTDFEAQFEAANNPNLDNRIHDFSFSRLLPDTLGRIQDLGLPAQRYIGEITSIQQPITHGGLSLRNLRNMAGMLGAFSFLLENRLDPSTGTYPTPHNIRARVSKQYLCITTFLESCRAHRQEMTALCRNARMSWTNPGAEQPLYLDFGYVADPSRPQITIPLRKSDTGEPLLHTFRYHGSVESRSRLALPDSYIITEHHGLMRDILGRHHIPFETARGRTQYLVEIQRVLGRDDTAMDFQKGCPKFRLEQRREIYGPEPEDILVSLNQPGRRLIPLLLDLESSTGLFTLKPYCQLAKPLQDFFIHRIRAANASP